MSFKGLQLNRDKIDSAILEYAADTQIEVKKISDLQANYTISVPGEEPTLISIYYPKGKVTLTPVKGRNAELAEKIAEHVVNSCIYSAPNARTIYKRDLSDEQFNELQQYVNLAKVSISAPIAIAHGHQYTLTATDGGTVVLNRYTNNAINIQGESIALKLILIEILSDVLPYKEAIAMQLESIDSKVTTDQVLDQLQEAIPTAFVFLDDTLKAITTPSIALKSINIPMEDFAYILYPALRGLEGLVKKMFKDLAIVVGENFGGYISYNPTTDIAVIEPAHLGKFTSGQAKGIEEAYRYYKKNRHGLFHVDGTINTTRMVETKEEALDILGEIFDTFEVSCKHYHA
ncbi:MAG: hypothetical protein EOO43_01760 [Flavobacterium sp.]|nr:MAG: hypothetical protein EOO43_01760 [Flavobacterium sp.]